MKKLGFYFAGIEASSSSSKVWTIAICLLKYVLHRLLRYMWPLYGRAELLKINLAWNNGCSDFKWVMFNWQAFQILVISYRAHGLPYPKFGMFVSTFWNVNKLIFAYTVLFVSSTPCDFCYMCFIFFIFQCGVNHKIIL